MAPASHFRNSQKYETAALFSHRFRITSSKLPHICHYYKLDHIHLALLFLKMSYSSCNKGVHKTSQCFLTVWFWVLCWALCSLHSFLYPENLVLLQSAFYYAYSLAIELSGLSLLCFFFLGVHVVLSDADNSVSPPFISLCWSANLLIIFPWLVSDLSKWAV